MIDVWNIPLLDKKELDLTKRIFVVTKENCYTSGDLHNIIGLTNDEELAKSLQSVFCGYKEIKLII